MGKNIKKTAIIAGAAVGGVIGGTISLVGKMTNKKLVDDIGSSIVDSTILTGEIIGDAASGTTEMVHGMMKKEEEKVAAGKRELKKAGNKVVGNVIGNVKNVAHQSGEITKAVVTGDKERAVKGAKTLGKMVAVGMLTVGAMKIEEDESVPPVEEAEEVESEAAEEEKMDATEDGETAERED